jgi:hypothetical protein
MRSVQLHRDDFTKRLLGHRSGSLVLAAVALFALLAAGVLAGCATVTAPQAPGAMNVSIEIQYFQQGNSHISVGFSDAKLNPIEFVSGETVACNNQFLRYDSNHYIGDVAKQPATGAYTITYTPARGAASGDTPISVTVKVVNAPVAVTSPQSGATVPIPTSAPLAILYQRSSVANTAIGALATDGRAHLAIAWPGIETGTISMTADNFTTFQGGPGMLTISRETTNHPSGTPFRSVDTHFKNITQVPVVWQ